MTEDDFVPVTLDEFENLEEQSKMGILMAGPDKMLQIVDTVRQLILALCDKCFSCAQENATRSTFCAEHCKIGAMLHRIAVPVPHNEDLEDA